MILKTDELIRRIGRSKEHHDDGLYIVPDTQPASIAASGDASLDLRLGRWLRTFRQARVSLLSIMERNGNTALTHLAGTQTDEAHLSKEYFIRFGNSFILHPGKFALGTTLEWIGLPSDLAGYVTGKSSWGRRGLIIETAAGIHPGFRGCLTLEITNLGEVPIALVPGMKICQVMFHKALTDEKKEPRSEDRSQFAGRRRPNLGTIRPDEILDRLRRGP